ncbi:hypothetical protein [Rhodococcus sp. BH5]|uniref:hypothetical protein n=1 Tax=Rhodococcus sp. BH5 TaxID=2871702 RepID=UPI0022CD4CC3|nr:hypothetical protein [Rhodococcus sp. BH5]MCZ9635230.1 hypothetical protein [Rhodococcus sp. BH5]
MTPSYPAVEILDQCPSRLASLTAADFDPQQDGLIALRCCAFGSPGSAAEEALRLRVVGHVEH